MNTNPSVAMVRSCDRTLIDGLKNGIPFPQIPYSPIAIYGDTEFHNTASSESWSGDGSFGDPYIIENYLIDVGGAPQSGIYINSTSVYFIIRHCIILGATTSGYFGRGILLENVTNGQLINNTCQDNRIGICLVTTSELNTLANNTCVNNFESGLQLLDFCANNTIHWNCFGNNPTNVVDNSTFNWYYYNYYSDYGGSDGNADGIGDTSHPIFGDAGNQDFYPLMYCSKPPTWAIPLSDRIIEFGSNFAYDLDATHAGPITWSLIASPSFTIDNTGLVTNVISLAVNNYPVQVRVSNIYGVSLDGSFVVTVQDTTSPTWVTSPTDQILVYATSLEYQLEATDLSGIDRWVIDDEVNFTISSTGLLANTIFLSPGIYPLTISVYDPYDNELSANITITVQAPILPLMIFIPLSVLLPVAVNRVIKIREKHAVIENIAINGKLIADEEEEPQANTLKEPIIGGKEAILTFNAGLWLVIIKKWGGELAVYRPFNIKDLKVTIKTEEGDIIKVGEIECTKQQLDYELKLDEERVAKCNVPPFICRFTPLVYDKQLQVTITIQAKQWKSKKAQLLLRPPPLSTITAEPVVTVQPTKPKESEIVTLPIHRFSLKRPSSSRVYGVLVLILPWIVTGLMSLNLHPLLDLIIWGISIVDVIILLMIVIPRSRRKKSEYTE
ncbi:MAG: NosD domain-containing protein [Candidatus Odinarchaeota archaeon]